MRYEKPEMDIVIFNENDIATNLNASNTQPDPEGSLGFQ